MGLSLVHSRALIGLEARPVQVEVHLANGLPSFTLVGLVDTEVKEARERVRSAIANAGLEFPSNKRITVNLAPADLPKDSGRFDLPIALGILAAAGQIDGSKLAGWEFAGELSLGGELRPVRGALAMSLALHRDGSGGTTTRLVLPPGSAEEAALVPQAQVFRARHLLDVVAQFLPEGAAGIGDAPPDDKGWARLSPTPVAAREHYPDLADVKGQAGARRALEIAAAGSHSLLMVGPPGSGKSMLAQRFAGLLPPMDTTEALESAAVASLAGRFRLEAWGLRPTCAPHHSASAVALVGGGCAVFLLMRLPRHNCDALTTRCRRENRIQGAPIHSGPAPQVQHGPCSRPQHRVVAWGRVEERANQISAPRRSLVPTADAERLCRQLLPCQCWYHGLGPCPDWHDLGRQGLQATDHF